MADRATVLVDDREIIEYLNELDRRGENLAEPMEDIAGVLEDAIERAFQAEADPATGVPWPALRPATIKKRGGEPLQILQDSGALAGSIGSESDQTSATAGLGEIYATTHHFGAKKGQFGTASGAYQSDGQGLSPRQVPIPWGDIPPRPLVGINEDDSTEIMAILSGYFSPDNPG